MFVENDVRINRQYHTQQQTKNSKQNQKQKQKQIVILKDKELETILINPSQHHKYYTNFPVSMVLIFQFVLWSYIPLFF